MADLVAAAVGFSVGAAMLLTMAFATTYRDMAMPWQSRIAGHVMLAALITTQCWHWQALNEPPRGYIVSLWAQSSGFYWLFLGILRPPQLWRRWEWFVPPIAFIVLWWVPPTWAVVLAMGYGTAGAVHLGLLVSRLGAVRRWFALERKVLALFAATGAVIALLGLAYPWLGWSLFFSVYAVLLALGFALVLLLLLHFPDLTRKTEEAVRTSYAVSTLSNVDRLAAMEKIKSLFEDQHVYRNENLNLAALSEMIDLTPHQTSELINTHLDLSFSRLLRHYRIEAAKRMLLAERRASVLSVGMAVGFNSNSNFYAAFKELTGTVPSQFRNDHPGDA